MFSLPLLGMMGIGVFELIILLALLLGVLFFFGVIFAVVFIAVIAANKDK